MKTLMDYIRESYIREADDDTTPDGLSPEELGTAEGEKEEQTTERGDIKFTIWKSPGKKVKWLDNNNAYQKIEYLYTNKEDGIEIDFLLGFDHDDSSWKLWMGKNGAVSYDNKPYKDFETDKFENAIVDALDTVEEIVADVKENPDNWVQFYVKL